MEATYPTHRALIPENKIVSFRGQTNLGLVFLVTSWGLWLILDCPSVDTVHESMTIPEVEMPRVPRKYMSLYVRKPTI